MQLIFYWLKLFIWKYSLQVLLLRRCRLGSIDQRDLLPHCKLRIFGFRSTELDSVVAERLSTRQLILHRISPNVCIYMYVSRFRPRGTSTCSRWRPTSYMDAAFVLLAHEGLEIRTNRSLLLTPVGLLQLQRD